MHAARWQQQASVWNAASAGTCVRHHGDRCDPSDVAAPDGVRLQPVGMLRMYPASPLTPCDGTSVGDRGSTGESHVARLVKFAPPMWCAQQDWAMGMPCDSCG